MGKRTYSKKGKSALKRASAASKRARTGGYLGATRAGVVQAGPQDSPNKQYHDTPLTLAAVPLFSGAACVMPSCVLIDATSGSGGRRGHHIRLLNVNFHGRLAIGGSFSPAADTGTTCSTRVRVIMVWDSQCSGAAPAPLSAILGSPAIPASVDAFRNYDNPGRFTVLHDKVYTMNSQGTCLIGATGSAAVPHWIGQDRNFRINKKVSLAVDYTADTTANTTTISKGNVMLYAFKDSAIDGKDIFIAGACRVKYAGSGYPYN